MQHALNSHALTLATATAAHVAPWMLRTEHEELSADKRKELLAKLAAGETFELFLDMVAYSQAPGVRNRKFVRFARLEEMAATGKGTAFLKDHEQHNSDALGGTIIESRPVQNGLAHEIHQTALIVEPWALRKALLGLMRAFSIGWNPMPAPGALDVEIHCTVCRASVRKCAHWRGDVVAGQVVEWEFQAAELLETSTVPIGAVREARPLEVRERSATALATELSAFGVTVTVPSAITKESQDMDKIALALGLPADAPEATILEALAKRDGEMRALAGARDAAEAAAKLALEQKTKTAEELAHEKAKAFADELVLAGKLSSGPLFDLLVAEHKRDPAAAAKLGASMTPPTPLGRAPQTDRKPDAPTAAPSAPGAAPDYASLAKGLNDNDQRLAAMAKVSPESFVAANYDDLAREYGWPKRSN